MELILTEDVPGLGVRGDLVTVARGYAQNYLLPKKLARVPTAQVIQEVRAMAARRAAEREARKAERMEYAKRLATAHVTIPMKAGKEGQLYGSVGPRQIQEALAAQGYEVEEKQVDLDPHLKALGDYDVTIVLDPEVQVPVKVSVVSEEET